MTKATNISPFQAMEDEAYHAFREWPIFLVIRQKELEAHLLPVVPSSTPLDTALTADDESRALKDTEQ